MATATKVPEVRDLTRVERIGKQTHLHRVVCLKPFYLDFDSAVVRLSDLCIVDNMVDFNTCLGAHSHIRGLGLDDALQPRQVIIIIIIIVISCSICL